MFNNLIGIWIAIWKELQAYFEDTLSLQEPKTRMRNQLRSLYGRGDITKERFLEQRSRLEWGQIGLGDIANLQQEALYRMRSRGEAAGAHIPEIERGLGHLYVDRGLLEELRAEITQRHKSLALEAGWIHEQVESARQSAQSALPDDAAARAYLEIWHRLRELSGSLDKRLRVLEGDLRYLNMLEAELRASISELKLLDSQAGLSELGLRLHQDLLTQGQK
jgi:hypothetical protein